MTHVTRILYRNHRGVIAPRSIAPLQIKFGANEYHREPQFLLVATDTERGVQRTFACADILAWGAGNVAMVESLGRLSRVAPGGPWRVVESGRYPGEDHLISAGDVTVMGHGPRASIAFLKAAGEHVRQLLPSEIFK